VNGPDLSVLGKVALEIGNIMKPLPETVSAYGDRQLRYPCDFRDNPEKIGRVLVPTGSGNHIPLSEITTISLSCGAQVVKSKDIRQAERNESILKIMQETGFLRNIDPSDMTYQKLIELNERIEQHLRDNSNPKNL
jgi:Cu/Ag efflux pump CusA